uniref:Uncharacterized protein n=1 Tax=Heterorhabditis bacteriophora TaxID=37862 RepID=A0A1I7X2T0_HETBA
MTINIYWYLITIKCCVNPGAATATKQTEQYGIWKNKLRKDFVEN